MFDNYNSTLGGLQWESRNSQWQRADRGAAGLWSRAPVESVKTRWSSREWTAHSQLEVRWKHLFSLRKALNTILLFLLLWENAIYFWQKCCYCSILASISQVGCCLFILTFSSACHNHFLAFAKASPAASFLSKDTCWTLNSKVGWNALDGSP